MPLNPNPDSAQDGSSLNTGRKFAGQSSAACAVVLWGSSIQPDWREDCIMTFSQADLDALIERMQEACFDQEDIYACDECIEKVAQSGEVAIPALVRLLEDPEQATDNLLAALESLRRIGGRSAYLAVEKALYNDHVDVQGAAAQAMSRLDPNGSIDLLLRALDAFTYRGTQADTILALAYARNPAACPRLLDLADQLDAVGQHGLAGVTRAAVAYIWEGIQGLESILADEGQAIEFRRGAAVILRQAHQLDAFPIALRGLQDDDEQIRCDALQSLIVLIHELKPQGTAIGAEIVSALIKTLSSEPSPRCRDQAAGLLGVMNDSVAFPALERASSDLDEFVRMEAMSSLETLKRVNKCNERV